MCRLLDGVLSVEFIIIVIVVDLGRRLPLSTVGLGVALGIWGRASTLIGADARVGAPGTIGGVILKVRRHGDALEPLLLSRGQCILDVAIVRSKLVVREGVGLSL